MTLPVGQISMAEVNTELGYSSTAQISLNDSAVRTLAGVPSGAISMQNLQGKANQFAFTISSNQTNANLRTLAINAGWNQTSKVAATIGSGVYISSNSTGTPALTISGSFPGGVSLTNNGYIVGMGGAGGAGQSVLDRGYVTGGSNGSAGGLALSVLVSSTVTNNGIIAGGGGGGGGGGAKRVDGKESFTNYAGGGGGGGRSSAAANSAGGTYGGVNSIDDWNGRPGGAGTVSSAGSGGTYYDNTASGGAGGGWGSSGVNGQPTQNLTPVTTRVGGAAGGAVSGNGYITWVATGTRYGSIS